jgi:MFS transporter, DHA2 family, multidrug resistance protein
MRNLGGSVGISFITTLLARQSQRHLALLMHNTTPGNPAYGNMRNGLAGAWHHLGSSMPDAMYHAGAQIYGMAQVQARLLAYVDVIWVMVAVTAVLVPIPFLMNRPKKLAAAPMGH